MRRLAEDLWVEESTIRFYGVRLQTRMAVVLLPRGHLLLYSPVWPTPEVRAELGRLGEVRYVLSPNKIHNQTLRLWAEVYPDAEIHVPPGLAERRPDLRVDAVLGDGPAPAWRDQLDQALTAGNVFFSEAVLLHRASRTLLVGDLVENLERATTSLVGRAAARLFGVGRQPVASPEFRLYTLDPEAAARSFSRITSWDFDGVFLCHGALIAHDGKAIVERVVDGVLGAARGRTAATRWVLRRLAAVQ